MPTFSAPVASTQALTGLRDLRLADVDGAARQDILGDDAGFISLHAFTGSGYPLLGTANLLLGPIGGLTFGPSASLWIGSSGVLKVLLPPYMGAIRESAGFGGSFGAETSFLITPSSAIFLNAGPHAIVAHLVAPPSP